MKTAAELQDELLAIARDRDVWMERAVTAEKGHLQFLATHSFDAFEKLRRKVTDLEMALVQEEKVHAADVDVLRHCRQMMLESDLKNEELEKDVERLRAEVVAQETLTQTAFADALDWKRRAETIREVLILAAQALRSICAISPPGHSGKPPYYGLDIEVWQEADDRIAELLEGTENDWGAHDSP